MGRILDSGAATNDEADTIVTAAILGFAAVHAELGDAYSFDSSIDLNDTKKTEEEQIREYQEFLDVLSALSEILEDNGVDSSALKDGLSPVRNNPGTGDRMIVGRPGGNAVSPSGRRAPLSPENAGHADFAEFMATLKHGGYLGKGAYTGATLGPDGICRYSSTTQCHAVPSLSHRWRNETRGVISGAHDKARPEGFGAAPQGDLVGYVHGMSYAMLEAIDRGAPTIPVEVASGTETVKLASCFGCTTYMWAAGFPPSSTHLGRGESWHPLMVNQENEPRKRAIIESVNTRFHLEVHNYLLRGARMLQKGGGVRAKKNYFVPSLIQNAAMALETKQRARAAEAHLIGANYFLDGLSRHEKDLVRIQNVLLSHYDGVSQVGKYVR